ncbi:MAG: hypothetical protein O3B43_00140 [Chloroflexi bacterium]|nr:hypothetical protein [Chloroflexota bacterium]
MAKTFYTDRDIEDLANQGVESLEVGDDVVLTDLAREKARRLGVKLVEISSKPARTAPASAPQTPTPSTSSPQGGELESRIFASVKARLGDQVDDKLLSTIVKRVIKSLGGDKQ